MLTKSAKTVLLPLFFLLEEIIQVAQAIKGCDTSMISDLDKYKMCYLPQQGSTKQDFHESFQVCDNLVMQKENSTAASLFRPKSLTELGDVTARLSYVYGTKTGDDATVYLGYAKIQKIITKENVTLEESHWADVYDPFGEVSKEILDTALNNTDNGNTGICIYANMGNNDAFDTVAKRLKTGPCDTDRHYICQAPKTYPDLITTAQPKSTAQPETTPVEATTLPETLPATLPGFTMGMTTVPTAPETTVETGNTTS